MAIRACIYCSLLPSDLCFKLRIALQGAVPASSKKRPRCRTDPANGLVLDRGASRLWAVKVLLVEDDRAIATSLAEGLVADGHLVDHVATGRAAVDSVADDSYDMVLLDLGLPDVDGREVCRSIRQQSNVPIIMITARGDELDRVVGLELGADDYVTKPFSMREVLARIPPWLVAPRRWPVPRSAGAGGADESAQDVGALRIDRRTRRVFVDGEPIVLTAKEFDVLSCLADDPGAVRTRTEILEQVWDINWFGPTKTVDAHVAALRKKLGDPRWIEAVRGVGFRLEPPPADEP